MNEDKDERIASSTINFENGVISSESLKEYLIVDDEKEIKEISTLYYPSGVKQSTKTFIADEEISSLNWDTTGKMILKLKYRLGNEILIDSL